MAYFNSLLYNKILGIFLIFDTLSGEYTPLKENAL